MENIEVLSNSRFYLGIDGMPEILIKKVSGLQLTLEAAGAMKSFGVTKGFHCASRPYGRRLC